MRPKTSRFRFQFLLIACVLWTMDCHARIEAQFLDQSRLLAHCTETKTADACYGEAMALLERYQLSRYRPSDNFSFLTGHRTHKVAVLIHSYTMQPSEMMALGRLIAADGDINVFPVVLEGHGARSIIFDGSVSLARVSADDWLADMEFAVNLAKGFGEKTYLAGYSLGGLLAIKQAEDRPGDIAGVLAVAPALGISNQVWLQSLAGIGRPLMKMETLTGFVLKEMGASPRDTIYLEEYVRGAGQLMKLCESVNRYCRQSKAVSQQEQKSRPTVQVKWLEREKAGFQKMRVPYVLVGSPADGVIDFATMARFTNSTSVPGELISIPNEGHLAYGLGAQDAHDYRYFQQAVYDFLHAETSALSMVTGPQQ